jgi:hypothetical protein
MFDGSFITGAAFFFQWMGGGTCFRNRPQTTIAAFAPPAMTKSSHMDSTPSPSIGLLRIAA